jgi:putative toxin-antitoxin system antitoxin component (TIGR02293 family)
MALAIAQQLEMKAARDTVEEARHYFGLKYVELAEALGVTPRSLLRYRNLASVPSRPVQARLEKVRQISHLLGEVFGNEDSEMGWLYSPVSMLRERRPIDLIRSGELDPVLAILAGLYSGAST